MPQRLHEVFSGEIERVAGEEGIPVGDLVGEIAELVGKDARMIYHWRTGRYELPASAIPLLCRRFDSEELVFAVLSETRRQAEEIERETFVEVATVILTETAALTDRLMLISRDASNIQQVREFEALTASVSRKVIGAGDRVRRAYEEARAA
jgi:hypothetical protein